jgi:hypothetical protein
MDGSDNNDFASRSIAAELLSTNHDDCVFRRALSACVRELQKRRQIAAEEEEIFRAFVSQGTQDATEHLRTLTEALQVCSRGLQTDKLVDFCQALCGQHEQHSGRLIAARASVSEQETLFCQMKREDETTDLVGKFRKILFSEPWAQALICQVCLEPLSVIVEPRLPCHEATAYLTHLRQPCVSSVCVTCWSKLMGLDGASPRGFRRVNCPICRAETRAPSNATEAWNVNFRLLRMADECLLRELRAFSQLFEIELQLLQCPQCQLQHKDLISLSRHLSNHF